MEEYTIIESDKKQAHVSLWLYAFDLFFILVWAVVAYGLRNMVAIKLRIPYGIFTMSVMIESGLGLELTDARKDHLADHYKDFKAEIKRELGKDFTDEAMIQKIDDMLSSVYSTYNDIVDDLNKSIEKYVPQERLLEYQKNNEVSHEQLPKKDIDVAPEMDMDYDLEI